MKRLKKAVYSACFIAGAVQLTACTQKLYGPPPTSAAVSPTEEVPEVVYGPPETIPQVTPPETQLPPAYESWKEVPKMLYGPPEMLEPTTADVPQPVYGPPPGAQFEPPVTQYEPSEEVPEDVYGPPEFFGEPAEEKQR